jgi:hypothetical protein
MSFRIPTACILLPGLLLLAGCQRLDTSATWKLETGDVYSLQIEPARGEQKVTATITASSPVTACLVLDNDFPAAREALQNDKAPSNPLDCKEKATDITLTATVPARQRYCLVVGSARKETEVKVKVTGR